MNDNMWSFIGILFLGIVLFLIGAFPEHTAMYDKGRKDTYKVAYEKGFMVKEITKDDTVIYKWKEQ
jgi:hypothetical protein